MLSQGPSFCSPFSLSQFVSCTIPPVFCSLIIVENGPCLDILV
uniref:Uncharacterized protein n=1 Tax=Anguilla anguilla TaxID=7936 RepID=A0A0E9RH69_ANGAN